MARMSNEVSNFKREQLLKLMSDPTFIILSNVEKAKVLEVDPKTLKKWWDEMSVDHWESIKEARDKYLIRDILEIDAGQIAKAKRGDTEAAKLVYQKLEGWSPKQTNENINKDEFSGLSAEEKLAKAKEIAARLGGKVGLGVVQPGDSEKKGVIEGGNG